VRILVLFALALPCWGAWGNGYTYRRTLTIDKTKVPNTDRTNFPVLFSGTYDYLAHTTHSPGKVTNLNGFDIIFTSDAAGSAKLDHEIETYAHDTGACIFWVRVPTVITATDTVIYLFYTNAAVSTSQQSIAGAWNSSYKGVFHLGDGTTLSAVDSTANAHDLTFSGSPTAAAMAGQIDGAAAVASSNQYSTINGSTPTLGITSARTVSAWLYLPDVTNSDENPTMIVGTTSGAYPGDTVGIAVYNGTRNVAAGVRNDTTTYTTTSTLTASTWYHVVATFSGTAINLYVNGSLVNSAARTATIDDGHLDVQNVWGWGRAANANVDEVRVMSGELSADWVATEYNNQSSPSTFYALGAETEYSAGASRRRAVTQ
jgi:hypothetical protein